ncbi:MAG TPA: heparinase II/III family protein, partial [Blastocatellia bacterium]
MNKLQRIIAKAQSLTFRELAAEGVLRARRQAAHAYHRATDTPVYPSNADLKKALGNTSLEEIVSRISTGSRPHLTEGLGDLDATVEAVRQRSPESITRIVAEATAILDHKITLFETEFDLGESINWTADPSTGAGWPLNHFTRTPIRIGGGSDVKFVWELSRFHRLVSLGQAYVITQHERYTEEFLSQVSSWNRQNPPGFGINWTVAMEAGIRSINLLAALDLFRTSPIM